MVSRKDLNSAELETVRISKNTTTVVTANDEVPTKEDALGLVEKKKCCNDTDLITCDASLRQREDKEALRCLTCARIVTVS